MERVKNFENLQRGSVYGCCELCGSWDAVETHHIFPGRGMRPLSEMYGAKIRLCHACHQTDADSAHNSRETRELLYKYGQRKVMIEQGWSMEEFRAIFGKNWLEPEEVREIEDMQEAEEKAEYFTALEDAEDEFPEWGI